MKNIIVICEENFLIAENLSELFRFIGFNCKLVKSYDDLQMECRICKNEIFILNDIFREDKIKELYFHKNYRFFILVIGNGSENINISDGERILYCLKPIEFSAIYEKALNILKRESKGDANCLKSENVKFPVKL